MKCDDEGNQEKYQRSEYVVLERFGIRLEATLSIFYLIFYP